MGAWFARFIGTLIGAALKEAGPELLAGVIREALSSKDEVSKPNDSLQRVLAGVDDPAGLLGKNASDIHSAGHGDDPAQVNQGGTD